MNMHITIPLICMFQMKLIHKGNRMLPPLLTWVVLVHTGEEIVFNPSKTSVAEAPMEVTLFNGTLFATCEVIPDLNLPAYHPKIYGQVLFKQKFPAGILQVLVNVYGFPTDDQQKRAIHIHQYGDLSQGCITAGPHYNPLGVNHPAHPGDFGNYAPINGTIRQHLNMEKGTLFGGKSILGRAVVIHEKEDDLGLGPNEESKRSGNAGRRIAGCVIGISPPSLWKKLTREMEGGNNDK
ncbi:extracellular superoxide dismutase [Cu-Zn] [Silurus asotus]|uniref:Extracellular superoxide dismutase [Cu-Zn] n=1 Tax=Silurus asotus TaxID=30991 RepID=A0AAD5B476_SILAS|nr:extracellular superoxide dismutase [Cu-Zn] [Silurus asotus]